MYIYKQLNILNPSLNSCLGKYTVKKGFIRLNHLPSALNKLLNKIISPTNPYPPHPYFTPRIYLQSFPNTMDL